MAITLDKTITRDSGNIINTDTNYSELNVKANGLVEDIVDHIETELTSAETQLNATVTTKVNEFDARINQIASIDDSTYNTDAIDTKATAMSKAAFEAIARDNRDKFAGSGFVEWGKHALNQNINEGIWTSMQSNLFYIGRDYSGNAGVSKTPYPLVNINGVNLKIFQADINPFTVKLPEAPTVTHADASNSGLVANGKFDDASAWNADAVFTLTGGVANVNGSGLLRQENLLEANTEYILSFEITNYTSGAIKLYSGSGADPVTYRDAVGKYTEKITAGSTGVYFYSSNFIGSIDNVSVIPTSAISRTDLTFLESWHEDTSEKGVLYDLGNVQYEGNRTVGDAGSFVGSDTYSLFGNWQQAGALVGNSISIASLTFAELQEFVGNPENNCYYDGDKLIQVRYRVRVVQGLGDEWYNVDPQKGQYLHYSGGSTFVSAKGKVVSVDEFRVGNANIYQPSIAQGTVGLFAMPVAETGFAYEGKCYALPIATVHRRNQGAYHPVFNSNGALKLYTTTNPPSGIASFYTTEIMVKSIADTFFKDSGNTNRIVNYGTGDIASTLSGRPDGLFYDQIHEGDITDLRTSAQDKSDLEVMNSIFNDAISGDVRGSEGEWEFNGKTFGNGTNLLYDYGTHLNLVMPNADSAKFVVGSKFFIEYFDGTSTYYDNAIVKSIAGGTVAIYAPNLSSQIANGWHADNGIRYIKYTKQTTRKKSNTILHCDIIGDPANYPQEWKDNGVIGTPLVVGENGEDYIPDGTSKTFKMSKKVATAKLALYSDDNGATWASFVISINATTNAYTDSVPSTRIFMIFYTTHTSMAEPTDNAVVSSNSFGDAIGISSATSGNIVSTLIGKIPTYATALYQDPLVDIFKYGKSSSGEFSNGDWGSPLPEHLALAKAGTTTPTVKTFPYVTVENGRKYINLVFKEMKYDTTWGDDNQFNIVDNVSTTTDDNGNVVLIGQKQIATPYFEKGK